MYFQDQPKVTLSFKTEQFCTDALAIILYTPSTKSTVWVLIRYRKKTNLSQGWFRPILNCGQTSYQQLSAVSSELLIIWYWHSICLPRLWKQSFCMSDFSCFRKFDVSTMDCSMSLHLQLGKVVHKTRREHCYSKSLHSWNTKVLPYLEVIILF